VQEIFVPEFYTATSGNYFGDIAILVTSIPFVLSQKVQPVCVDWSLTYENDMSNPSTNLTGYVNTVFSLIQVLLIIFLGNRLGTYFFRRRQRPCQGTQRTESPHYKF
jgi:hypothetical protein